MARQEVEHVERCSGKDHAAAIPENRVLDFAYLLGLDWPEKIEPSMRRETCQLSLVIGTYGAS